MQKGATTETVDGKHQGAHSGVITNIYLHPSPGVHPSPGPAGP
jgi:hypothetical protein